MSQTTSPPLDADDPGLTAFALGELDGPDAARYAALVAGSADLRTCVAEIQAAGRVLTSELAREPKVPLAAEVQQEIAAQASQSQPLAASRTPRFRVLARRAAAVAASIALVPGAWYGYHAAFPKPTHRAAMEMANLQASGTPGTGYYTQADVQYFPAQTADASKTQLAALEKYKRESHKSAPEVTGWKESGARAPARHTSETLVASVDSPLPTDGFRDGDVAVSRRAFTRSPDKSPVAGPGGQPPAVHDRKSDDEFQERARPQDSSRPASGSGGQAAGRQGNSLNSVSSLKGDVTVESAPDAGVLIVRGNQKEVDKAMAEVRKAERSGAQPEAGQPASSKPRQSGGSEGQPGARPSSTPVPVAATTSTSPGKPASDFSALDKRQKGNPVGSKPKNGQPDSYSLDTLDGKSAAPVGESKPQLLLAEENKGSKRGRQNVEREKEGGRKSNLSVTDDALALGDRLSIPIAPGVAGGPAATPAGADSKKSGDLSLAQKPGQTSFERQEEGESIFDGEKAVVTKQKGREIALAEIDRITKKRLGDLSKEDVNRLGWARKELNWDDGGWNQPGNEAYNPIFENAFLSSAEQPLSTFSIDVDTASYANLRRFLQNGQLPPPDAVRIEELVNYFAYQYPQPQDGRPFSVQTDIAACPWQPGHQLVRIGLKGKEIPKEQRPPTNLVFLVDVSGSMSAQNKLPLVRESLTTLVKQLDERDKVAIVTYAGEAGLRLPSTSVAQRETILTAIAGLGAGGSTNGAAGINTAYDIAAQEFLEKGTNRVILCTDGDFNVGVTSDEALVQMIQTRAKGGVFLSIFGFGMGNLKDAKLEQLADKGNGQYGYIDDTQEANKVFVQELMGTLVTIAKDVKIQIDFNKDTVSAYRLVGYENRVMAAEDFANDKKDAGEIGAGHTVTALYQIVPVKDLQATDETRWLTVKLRYKQPDAATSVLFENPLIGQPGQLKLAASDFQFAAGVAATGMLLRHSQYAGQANWALVKELAESGLSFDPHGHRRAFLGLVSQAESLMGQPRPASPPAPDSTVRGKYKSLLRRLNAPEDNDKYGQFNDYGYSDTKTYAGSDNLPAGYWVYIAPHWYIWAESTEQVKK